jgi:hypothetical protein
VDYQRAGVRQAVEADISPREVKLAHDTEDAVEKLSLLDRYPMALEIDFMGPMVMKWNVNRLWDVLTDR